MKKVTIQGVTGCFHEAAARNYFEGEEIETIPCVSFENLFNVMAKER
ncbi:MAG: prephenate dehydratase domain-containing protein, partial [Bacteroidales bacterium]